MQNPDRATALSSTTMHVILPYRYLHNEFACVKILLIQSHLEVFTLDNVDREPGDGRVEADGEQNLRKIRLRRLHVLLKVGRQVLRKKGMWMLVTIDKCITRTHHLALRGVNFSDVQQCLADDPVLAVYVDVVDQETKGSACE